LFYQSKLIYSKLGSATRGKMQYHSALLLLANTMKFRSARHTKQLQPLITFYTEIIGLRI